MRMRNNSLLRSSVEDRFGAARRPMDASDEALP